MDMDTINGIITTRKLKADQLTEHRADYKKDSGVQDPVLNPLYIFVYPTLWATEAIECRVSVFNLYYKIIIIHARYPDI
jgi:hypothetical protein